MQQINKSIPRKRPQRMGRKFGRSTIHAEYQQTFINRVYTVFLNFGRELKPTQKLNKDLVDIEGIETQNESKWVEN